MDPGPARVALRGLIGDDQYFPPGSYDTCLTNRTKLTPYARTQGLGGEPGGCNWGPPSLGATYYWKVRAIDDTGDILGIFSELNAPDTWRFIYIGDLPTLLTPGRQRHRPDPDAHLEPPSTTSSSTASRSRIPVGRPSTRPSPTRRRTRPRTCSTRPTSRSPWYVTTIDGVGNPGVIPGERQLVPLLARSGHDRHELRHHEPGRRRLERPHAEDDLGSVHGRRLLQGPVRRRRVGLLLRDAAQRHHRAQVCRVHVHCACPWRPARTTTRSRPTARPTPRWPRASSRRSRSRLRCPRIARLLVATRCTLIATCTTLADTPTIEWEPVAGAGAYEVTLANDAEFTNEIKRYKTIFTTITPRESLLDQQAGQAIYWFVKPCVDYALTRCGPNAQTNANDNASAFRKNSAAIEILTPTAGQTIANQITFTWRPYLTTNQALNPAVDQEARSYKIEVSTVADFATIFDTATVDQTTYTPFSKTYPEGPLYWRVQAIDGSGNTLTKSPSRLVNKASPALSLTFPGNGSTQSGVPYFQWNPQAFAATYLIEVYKNGDLLFSPANKVLSTTTKFSAWAPTTSLASGDYAWRVRRNDADNRPGPWSAGRTFTLQSAKPTLTAPANGATVAANTLLFTWGGVAGAVQYKIEVAATCAFSAILFNQTTVMTSWAPITAYADGSYCWRIKALDAAGNVLNTSNTRTFNIGTGPPPPPTSTTFVPIDPVRLLDTRFDIGLNNRFTANIARSVDIAGRLSIPNDAVAITANLTVVGQQQAGYLSVTPDPDNSPSTSALNFPLGDVRANNITSPLADDGKLSIVYKAGVGKTTHVLLDVTGYFLENNTGATFEAITPARLLDTRFANGLSGKFTSHVVRDFDVAGRSGVPANATAVTGNLTVVGQNDDGYVTLGPDLADNPETSTINFPLADTRANGITVRLDTTTGHLDAIYIAAPGKTTHLLFDVTGYYVQDLTGSKFFPLDPGRVLDSRFGTGLSGTFKTDIARALQIEGHVGVPAAAVGITGNLTVVGQTDDGYVSMTQALDNTPGHVDPELPDRGCPGERRHRAVDRRRGRRSRLQGLAGQDDPPHPRHHRLLRTLTLRDQELSAGGHRGHRRSSIPGAIRPAARSVPAARDDARQSQPDGKPQAGDPGDRERRHEGRGADQRRRSAARPRSPAPARPRRSANGMSAVG